MANEPLGREKVEMRPAYNWTCPECGRDSFCRSISAEVTLEDCEQMGLPPEAAGQGRWMTYPNHVVCEHCGIKFATISCVGCDDEGGDDEGH